jgi:outer membrane protein assembly factor BamB
MRLFPFPFFCSLVGIAFLQSCKPIEPSLGSDTLVNHADWLYWRGPAGTGVSTQTGLPEDLNGSLLWTHEIQGGGVPVIAGGRAYQFGYYGVEDELQEALVCFDAKNGEILWDRRHSDFISDIVYNRYGVGAACVDQTTGNVFFQTSPGLLIGYDPEGNKLWERSLMEEFARLTFPNGRTGGPCVDENLVIIHAITANWGKQGPARDRFYAFDKTNGDLVWSSTPGITPKDSSFSPLIFEDLPGGRRVFYSGTGCGNIVCIDARTGQPLWRFQMSHGGVNSGVILHKDKVVAIHGKENLDSSVIGRMVAIKKPSNLPGVGEELLILGKEDEAWRNSSMEAFTSSPVYKDGRIYTTIKRGELVCMDADNGEEHWVLKLAPDQVHASPTWAEGKLYVPMFDGKVFIVVDKGNTGEMISEMDLGSACLAAPAVAHGRVFIQTKRKLFCFGSADVALPFVVKPSSVVEGTGPMVSLQVVPAEFALKSGDTQAFQVYGLDKSGNRIKQIKEGMTWEKWIPESAKVKSEVDAYISSNGILSAERRAKLSAGALRVKVGDLYGVTRGRVLQDLPYEENFEENFNLIHESSDGIQFSYPPLSWLGARMRWQVQVADGNHVAGNTLDRVLFQRAINFIGHKDMSNYTMSAEVMTDGDRRIKSNVGLINQRYIFVLVGNSQKLEVVSNFDRFRHAVPFSIKTKTWYCLKTRVDIMEDGTGLIRAKAWPKDGKEPEAWTLEVPHQVPHLHGSPGLYAMSPQSKKKVYLDNVKIIYNP